MNDELQKTMEESADNSKFEICDSIIRATRRGFTLIELLVVIAMLSILMGAVTSSVSQSRRRTKITKATQDVKEITNAILAYQNYAPNRSLETKVSGTWKDTTETALSMILGKEQTEGGGQVPVLYNAQIRGGAVVDPWGTPYQFMIKKLTENDNGDGAARLDFVTAPNLPNFFRLTDEERQ